MVLYVAQRHQRSEVAISPGPRSSPRKRRFKRAERMRRLLMGGLRGRGGTGCGWPGQGAFCAVAERKDVRIPCRLQRLLDLDLIQPVGFQPAYVFQKIGRLDAGAPYHEFGGDEFSIRGAHAGCRNFGDFLTSHHLHMQRIEQLRSRLGHTRFPALPAVCAMMLR